MRKAFTLIELLVVIAIIAILAAILFPVFAQAKAAAKATAELSQIKQIGTGFAIYTADHDDMFPLAYAVGGNTWYTQFLIETPADWFPGQTPQYYMENENHWANSTYPYVKNPDIYRSNVGRERTIATAAQYASATKAIRTNGYQMNGLLNAWSATAVNSPSQLPLLTQNRGNMNIKGYATSNPRLICSSAGGCQFVPSTPTCAGTNGTWSEMFLDPAGFSKWVHNKGHMITFTDTSAKRRSMNGAVGQRSDFRTMYWTRFTNTGESFTEWQDTNFCHTMLFQPDFDFATFGTPIEY